MAGGNEQSSCGLSRLAQVRFHELFQYHCVVVLCIMRAENQGQCALAPCIQQLFPEVRLLLKLSAVATLEFAPFRGIMAEPFSQLGAWSNVLKPTVQRQPGLCDSAGPQTLHQNPPAIFWAGRIIRAFQQDHCSPPGLLDSRRFSGDVRLGRPHSVLPNQLCNSQHIYISLCDIIAPNEYASRKCVRPTPDHQWVIQTRH
jgi:hypothetical protein